MKLAIKLIQLHINKPKLYAFLNTLFNILIKPIPIFVAYIVIACTHPDEIINNRGALFQQNIWIIIAIFVQLFVALYLFSIATYLLLLFLVQFFKLMLRPVYKWLIIRIYILDLWIGLFQKKIEKTGAPEDVKFLKQHRILVQERKEHLDDRIQRAYDKALQKLEDKYVYHTEERDRARDSDTRYYHEIKAKQLKQQITEMRQ